ncbi:MAG: GAF and ANTAR domain-containing protein [Ilumatobacteraceae bacterium]
MSLTASTFVELADTLVDEFDVVDVLTLLASRCVELLDAAAAGILLVDEAGHLRVVGASSEQVRLLELFQLQNEEGPCLDCFRTGRVVIEADLATATAWPLFAAESVAAGLPSVCAVPLRLRNQTLGCLNMFVSVPRAMSDADIALARALADVATIALVQDQATRAAAVREAQLQHALDSRVVIEQAKGMIAERAQLDLDAAFGRLRSHARSNNAKLTDLARRIVDGSFPIDRL